MYRLIVKEPGTLLDVVFDREVDGRTVVAVQRMLNDEEFREETILRAYERYHAEDAKLIAADMILDHSEEPIHVR